MRKNEESKINDEIKKVLFRDIEMIIKPAVDF